MSATATSRLRAKIRQIARHGPWFVLTKFVGDHIVGRTQYVYLQRDLALPHKNYARQKFWTIRILDGDRDLELFRVHFGRKMDTMKSLFDQGLLAGGAFVDDVLVGYGWFAVKDFHDPYSDFLIELREGEVYQFDVFLIPEYRGTLIVLDAMRMFHEHLDKSGFERAFCLVNLARPGNIKLHLKLGFEEMGALLTTTRLLGWRWSAKHTYRGTMLQPFSKKRVSSADRPVATPDRTVTP